MRSEVGDRSSGSQEELQQFLYKRTSSINDEPRDDFEGLSSAQMHEILHAREAERVPLLRFNGLLAAADAETAPLVATISGVLRYHADHGGTIRLTARRNYPRALCRAYLSHFVPRYREGMTVPNEESLFLLVLAHDLLVAFGWTTETKKLSEITTEGVQMLGSGSSSGGGRGSSSGGAGEVFRRGWPGPSWCRRPGRSGRGTRARKIRRTRRAGPPLSHDGVIPECGGVRVKSEVVDPDPYPLRTADGRWLPTTSH